MSDKPTQFTKALGKQLKLLRLNTGLSQRELSIKLGLHWNTISVHERGKYFNLNCLVQYSEFFHIPVSTIVYRAEKSLSSNFN